MYATRNAKYKVLLALEDKPTLYFDAGHFATLDGAKVARDGWIKGTYAGLKVVGTRIVDL